MREGRPTTRAGGAVLAAFVLLLVLAAGAAGAAETRPFRHLMGVAQVPVAPARVATLQDHTLLLPLLELGFRPVASAGRFTASGEPHFRGTADHDTSGVAFLGMFNEPDLEALVAARPDLIVGTSTHRALYPLLSAIAPTVILPAYQVPVPEHSGRLADLVGRTGRHAALLEEYRRRVDRLRGLLGDPSRIAVAHVQLAEGGFWAPRGSPIDDVLRDVGFARPAAQAELPQGGARLVLEALPRFDADVIVDTYEPLYGTREATGRVREGALWRSLFAVRRGQFIYAERSRWMGLAFGSLFAVLDGLERHLAGRPVATRPRDPTEGAAE
jgi:iron complex transport system substrate-binding protein